MANLVRNFIKGRMNKSVDERLVPEGEYIDAQNIRMGSTEDSEVGSIENTKGNTRLTTLVYPPTGTALSDDATCLGAYSDGANETMYWFVHDPSFTEGATNKLDLIVSYNTRTDSLTYHVVSIDDGGGADTTLNFNPQHLFTGVDFVDELLFFTDDINPPRRINVTRSYPQPTAFIDDGELRERILVVKAAPRTAPLVAISNPQSENNYMEERFICFGYRYRYEEDEYSATSQFSGPAFSAQGFFFSPESLTNEGMENAINNAIVTINTGGNLVKGFDILFKEMDDSIIRVIEKFDKQEDGIPNNSTFTYEFDNSKIFTILNESEILRLYDNVPRLAKAQTMMGNRLVYGNYLEGYDLVERPGVPIRLNYFATHIKEDLGSSTFTYAVSNATTYLLGGLGLQPELTLQFTINDFVNLEIGDSLEISLRVRHTSWSLSGGGAVPTSTTAESTVRWNYVLDSDYATLSDMCLSPGFSNSLGWPYQIETDPAQFANSNQSILSNAWNAIFPLTATGGTPDPQNLLGTGIDALGDPVRGTVISDDTFQLVFPIPQYSSGATNSFEVLELDTANTFVNYFSVGSQRSLHSNRSYEVGIVYMDEYGRSSTALVSERNQIHVPCGDSIMRNQLRVQIPFWNPAPYWADRYKFVIKPDREGYETIYSQFFFDFAGGKYCLLEGEQAAKVEKGDRYIVKADCQGAIGDCTYVTVKEKKAYAVGELSTNPSDIPAIAGTYMLFESADIDITVDPNAVYDSKWQKECKGPIGGILSGSTNQYPIVSVDTVSGAIGAGSRIFIGFRVDRRGVGDGDNSCEERFLLVKEYFTAQEDYTDFTDFFYNQDDVIPRLTAELVQGGNNSEYDVVVDDVNTFWPDFDTGDFASSVRLKVETFGAIPQLVIKGTASCNGLTGSNIGGGRKSCVKLRVKVVSTNETLIFETLPQDAPADLWYESPTSYDIVLDSGTGNRYHTGNLQNQSATQNAIIDTGFFNCIAYGNGVESYKIRDSIKGKPITLGNRVTTVSEQDYKEIRRFADVTYSGVYNDETNLNRLNEFNLGLLNFKPLEDSYGPVEKLFGRRTDILTLQEDKISYILANKNLLTDSTGESVVASVPEVLGNQVARTEDYGISNNPESFAEFGSHKFFTDAKRGVVIHLFGDNQNERLTVISAYGMRSWFRDMFIGDFNTQKLGGYDPYMDEYVLASNENQLPGPIECIECGVTQTFLLERPGTSFCVDVGSSVGDVTVSYEIVTQENPADTIDISTTYDNNTVVTAGISQSSPTPIPLINKDLVQENQVGVDIDYAGVDRFVLRITVSCPDADQITIKLITLTRPSESGQLIHNEYRWEQGAFVSPLHSQQIKFLSGATVPVVSQFTEFSGPQGGGVIPTDASVVEMRSNRFGNDTYILKASDRFRYVRSTSNWGQSDLTTILSASTEIIPVGGPSLYSADFVMPGTGDYLYLIWDYSSVLPTPLCFDVSKAGACCACVCDATNCQEYSIYNGDNENVTMQYTACGGSISYITIAGKQSTTVCSDTYPAVIAGEAGYVEITTTNCDC